MADRIEDYALLGDTHAAALVSRHGSIDWLCLPRFDSPACFAALLGEAGHGRWLLAPTGGRPASRRAYRDGSLVLETTWDSEDGSVTVIDCMPPRNAEPDVVRIVRCTSGRVRMRMELVVRFDYGSIVPWARRVDGGMVFVGGPDALVLRTPVATEGRDRSTVAEFTVTEGDEVPFTLQWFRSHEELPPARDAAADVAEAEGWWRTWTGHTTYEGPHQEMVARSLVVLKALTYAPTGGIVAAPTTSLPEHIGGVRNWDYRFCWLRDATFTLDGLLVAGHRGEAEAFRDWLLRAVAGDTHALQIMYGVAGERRLTEVELSWLPGYEGSAPVRVGNGAWDQMQHDVYGEVMSALHDARKMGMDDSGDAWEIQRQMLACLEERWREPDEGIWEVRSERMHFTHSKVMAWVAFDRAVHAVEQHGLEGPVDRWRAVRQEIHDEVCERGFDTEVGAFVQAYGQPALDASLLMIPLVGFLPATDPRMTATIEAIERDLTEDGFVHRYDTGVTDDGLPGDEGTFTLCSFWLADCLHQLGREDDARALFDRLCATANDVGLLAEQWDPKAGRQLGNFPQAFSHTGLVNTAFRLAGHDELDHHCDREEHVAGEVDRT